jgi:hypothetical protein
MKVGQKTDGLSWLKNNNKKINQFGNNHLITAPGFIHNDLLDGVDGFQRRRLDVKKKRVVNTRQPDLRTLRKGVASCFV